ncbi:MAG: chorismate lyase [Orrella sp.]
MTSRTPILNTYGWFFQPSPLANSTQKRWLIRTGALTEGLRELGGLDLVVLTESIQTPQADERLRLQTEPQQPAWVREVLMSINGVPAVVARSLTPLAVSRGTWRGIRQLGARPLADLLYNDPQVQRSRFEFTRARSTQGIHQALRAANVVDLEKQSSDQLFTRRSLFVRHGKKLLVSECFLPAFWQLNKQKKNP